MTTYSDASFNTQHYDDSRPNYPKSFYQELMRYHDSVIEPFNYHTEKYIHDVAIDTGCGSGFVAYELCNHFKKVYGIDPSQAMIKQCNEKKPSSDQIQFEIGYAEAYPGIIAPNSIDLITGAECCHWVDHPKFFKESARVLKKGGTLAYWFYKDPVFVGFPKANEIYTNYTYNSSLELNPEDKFERYMGPYYQQPGHDYLRTLLKEIEVPQDLFTDVLRHEYIIERDGYPTDFKKGGDDYTPLFIHKRITLKWFLNYVKSWSAYHSWMKDHGDKYNIAERFVDELKLELGWTDDTELDVVWDTVYTFARKR
ncbi:S-adenosyl-L-methionine-dependent methyltransferase [Scheffersomyces coipomensis]|uniref:S-adenosyl-L-methionine-dependent methyltransferase n=1 Tax=Scheffersomyces coipomensis TaxID=1788519 RepID=UPI00315D0E4C